MNLFLQQSFPPKGENGEKSSMKKSDIERNLDGLSIREVETSF